MLRSLPMAASADHQKENYSVNRCCWDAALFHCLYVGGKIKLSLR
jgi:hypothetical protein